MLGHTQESGDISRTDFGQYLVDFLACDWSKPSILDCDWSAVEVVSAMFDRDNHEEMFYCSKSRKYYRSTGRSGNL